MGKQYGYRHECDNAKCTMTAFEEVTPGSEQMFRENVTTGLPSDWFMVIEGDHRDTYFPTFCSKICLRAHYSENAVAQQIIKGHREDQRASDGLFGGT